MYLADHVIQSLSNPHDRHLVFKDTETGATEQIQLPDIGPQIVWFDGHMYDCWGREVVLHQSIKQIHQSMGIGHSPHYVLVDSPVYLVEKQNGTFAFAHVTYIYDNGYQECAFRPSEYPLTNDVVSRAELKPLNLEYSSVEQDFFKGTAIGDDFEGLGLDIWLARVVGSDEAQLIRNPFSRIYDAIWRHYGDDKPAYEGGACHLVSPHWLEDGSLRAQIRGAQSLSAKDGYYRLLTVELSHEGLRTCLQYSFDQGEKLTTEIFHLPFLLLADDPDPERNFG